MTFTNIFGIKVQTLITGIANPSRMQPFLSMALVRHTLVFRAKVPTHHNTRRNNGDTTNIQRVIHHTTNRHNNSGPVIMALVQFNNTNLLTLGFVLDRR